MKLFLFGILFSVAASNKVEASPVGFQQGILRRNLWIWSIDVRIVQSPCKPSNCHIFDQYFQTSIAWLIKDSRTEFIVNGRRVLLKKQSNIAKGTVTKSKNMILVTVFQCCLCLKIYVTYIRSPISLELAIVYFFHIFVTLKALVWGYQFHDLQKERLSRPHSPQV